MVDGRRRGLQPQNALRVAVGDLLAVVGRQVRAAQEADGLGAPLERVVEGDRTLSTPTALTAAWSMVSSMTPEVVMAMLSTTCTPPPPRRATGRSRATGRNWSARCTAGRPRPPDTRCASSSAGSSTTSPAPGSSSGTRAISCPSTCPGSTGDAVLVHVGEPVLGDVGKPLQPLLGHLGLRSCPLLLPRRVRLHAVTSSMVKREEPVSISGRDHVELPGTGYSAPEVSTGTHVRPARPSAHSGA